MAFHPLRTFQKNRKFWMATILLVTMVTFVLCTGFQGGDFGDWLLRLIGQRRGEEITRIDGRAVMSRDLEELKLQRDIANDYMRKATRRVMYEVKMRIEEAGKEKDDKKRQARLVAYQTFQILLSEQMAKPRYFGGGTKLDDLLDFIIWRNQADRLGVRLTEDSIKDLVAEDLYNGEAMKEVVVRYLGVRNLNEYYATMEHMTRWGPRAADYVQQEVRQGGFYQANYRLIVEALTEEFRVRSAKMALERSPLQTLEPVAANTPVAPEKLLGASQETRMPVTLE